MNSRCIRPFRAWLIVLAGLTLSQSMILVSISSAVAMQPPQPEEPVDDMKIMDQVDQLLKQLASTNVEKSDAAEKELIKLGVPALNYLEPPADASTEYLKRLARIRAKLEKLAVEKFTQASKVTLKGKFTVEKALQSISSQTGNQLSTDEVFPESLEKQLELNLSDVEFWNALYEVMNQASLMIDPLGGETGALKIIQNPSREIMAMDEEAEEEDDRKKNGTRCLSGMFDFSVAKVISQRDFTRPDSAKAGSTQLNLTARWEPRMKPISVEMPFELITVLDDNDEELKLLQEDGVFYAAASAEFPEIELVVPLELVNRKVKRIKSLQAVLVTLLPGHQEVFRFKSIGKLKEGAEQQKGGAIVTYEGTIKNEDLFGVTLKLSFDESFNALESHRAWAYDNPMYLEDEQGNKIEPVTFEGLRQSNEEVAIRYYFTEDPKNFSIVYKTITAIVKKNVPIKLSDIDLP